MNSEERMLAEVLEAMGTDPETRKGMNEGKYLKDPAEGVYRLIERNKKLEKLVQRHHDFEKMETHEVGMGCPVCQEDGFSAHAKSMEDAGFFSMRLMPKFMDVPQWEEPPPADEREKLNPGLPNMDGAPLFRRGRGR